ncbi:hypothetical protein ATCC90586_004470 [Pythium insidiosum]|nr:hypothetical protein ATCC90586_004470 [Pythium insidiosum]
MPPKLRLELQSPELTPPPEYEDEHEETGSNKPRWASKPPSEASSAGIYEYLDEIETQSEAQLQTMGPGSIESISSRRSTGSRRLPPVRSADWVSGSKQTSPTPSYRSSTDDSHQYYVGIKEKLATLTIELNDKTKTIELLKMARKKDKAKWVVKKTEEIKKSTVKALEPDIQAILAKGKADLEKAQEAAAEERRKLQVLLERERETALQRLKEEYERKLVDAREKERSKLISRLDAADAELQQQLSTQRRRLQEEAEQARNEVYAELRAVKLAQAKEVEEIKLQESRRIEAALEGLQKEKEELARKYDRDLLQLREQTTVDCEQFKTQLTAKLRQELEKEKAELERQMLASRDAKLEMVISKLQEESREAIEKAEQKAKQKLEHERREWERKLKHVSEIEGVWMEKNRELHDKVARLEAQREELRQQAEELSNDAKRADDKAVELNRVLHDERRANDKAARDLERRCDSLEQELALLRQQQTVEQTQLRERASALEDEQRERLRRQQSAHDAELASLHERIKATIARKDQVIANLQDELHILQAKLEKSQALIEEQRLQLFGE